MCKILTKSNIVGTLLEHMDIVTNFNSGKPRKNLELRGVVLKPLPASD